MKTPRVQDFEPNQKPPELGSPMDGMPIIRPPAKNPEIPISRNQDNPNTRNQEFPKTRKEDIRKGGNQEILIPRKPDIPKSGNQTTIKVPKYYTQLQQALQDEIKVYAIRQKVNDYEVVMQAIEEFFKKQK